MAPGRRKNDASVADSVFESSASTFVLQTWALTRANLKSRYRKTFAGFIWVVLNPLIMFGAQSYAFSHVLRINMNDYPRFLLSGLLPWIFIAQSLEMCTSLLVSSGKLLKSFTLHPMVFLCSQLLDNLINFVAAFGLILVPVFLHAPAKAIGLLFLPLPLLVLLAGVLGLCWLLAVTQVFFRDTRFVVSFVLSVAFFLTPIFYPVELVPPAYRMLVAMNPLYRLIVPFQVCIYDFELGRFIAAILPAAAVALIALGLASLLWLRKQNEVYLNV